MNQLPNFSAKSKNYKDYLNEAKLFFETNFEKIRKLFEDKTIKDFVFEPFAGVFEIKTQTIDKDIFAIITQVALVNAIIAGMPGKLGVGIFVSIALEAWMAFSIAKHIGINFQKPSDVFDYFGMVGASLAIIFWGMKAIISVGFSLFSILPFINPLVVAELIATDVVGAVFFVGFLEVKKSGNQFKSYAVFEIFKYVKEILNYQFETLKNTLTIENIKLFASRFKAWLNGDLAKDMKIINGYIFSTAAMTYLINEHFEKLEGPLGSMFLEAIRLRWSSQLGSDASIEDIAKHFQQYSPEQLEGAINTIKGKMFELMVEKAENTDNDNQNAELFSDESHPDSDIIFTNNETMQSVEVSLKATNNKEIIEEALMKYPDTPIMTTDEMAEIYSDDPRVMPSGFSNEYIQNITEENVDSLINSIEIINETQIVVSGVAYGAIGVLWPFVVAYSTKKITYEKFEMALSKILPDIGVSLASRLSYLLIFGPVFTWYLLSRGIILLSKKADNHQKRSMKLKL